MKLPICSRCKRFPAVVFVTQRLEGENQQTGLCLRCARELQVEPITDLLNRFGITNDDIDAISGELLSGNGEMLDGLMQQLMPSEWQQKKEKEKEKKGESLPAVREERAGGDGREPGEPDDDEPDDESDEGETEQPFRAPAFPLFSLFHPQQPPKQPERGREEGGKRPDKRRKTLMAYAIDLNRRAREGKLDPLIGRDAETLRVVQILNRRQKNNPCLIGEPGVGKTAVAEGLAQRIVKGEVPLKLRDKEVWVLDMTAMLAGTQFRGQFEARMKSLIDEVKALGNIILVLDEVHNLVGAGDAEGSMNAATILKPALSRGEVQVIGATTFREYRKFIEKDAALERRFQPVIIEEPTQEETVEILRGIKAYYESFHGVVIDDRLLPQVVYLADRYLTDRFMPDKAIDLLDEACSDLNLRNPQIGSVATLQKELDRLIADQCEMENEEHPNDALYERMAQTRSRMLQVKEELTREQQTPPPRLGIEDLSRVIEVWTHIPASRVQEEDYERLNKLASRLRERVIGQDEAVDAIASAIRRRRAGISGKRKPISFIFVGSTGVGKTELVKRLAIDLFGEEDALIRLDMSEYMEPHSVSKLIGAPPGYVGYDEAGQLTEKIRRRPYSVVLFDEIEKAHPDVLNMLLQILDDGRITDAQGRRVHFENTVIIMTSNAGSERRDGSVGFGKTVTAQGKERAVRALSEIMRPEFLNRVDEIVAFNHLTREDFSRICEIMLSDLRAGVAHNGIELVWDEALVRYLVDKSFSVKFGARNLRRLIEKELEDKAATVLLSSYGKELRLLRCTVQDGEVSVTGE